MKDFLTSLRLVALSLVVCSVLYPLAVLAFAKKYFPANSEGSLLTDAKGTVVGSKLICQRFSEPRYFWPRPSAVDYNAAAAGGSNLSPTNPKVTERVKEILRKFQLKSTVELPAELATASGSGLDPHITLGAARLQAPRVARSRGLSLEDVLALVRRHTDSPTLVAFGEEPLINVLELNLALDRYRKMD